MKEIMDGISRGKSFVRLNSLNRGSEEEINSVIALGVRNVMLPFFHDPKEVEIFLSLVNKRARVILLLETAAALIRIEDILAIKGIDEVMVGLNDLRIATSVTSHFEILISPVMDLIAKLVKEAGLPLSVGGVARYEMTTLPVSPDLVLAQYPRLNATGAWISRSMVNSMRSEQEISAVVKELRNRLTYWSLKSSYELEAARQELRACLRATFPQN